MAQCQSNLMLETSNSIKITTFSNWEIENHKNFDDCVSSVSILQAPESTNLEDVVTLETCLALKSGSSEESCRLDFKVNDKQKIARIAVVSEASVLEFFKQSGEYAATVFAEFVDEFQDHAVYFAEAKIEPPSTEAGIKFTRTKNKGTSMWIYGIKLIIAEPTESANSPFNLDIINSFFDNSDQEKLNRIELAKKFLETCNNKSNPAEDMNTCFQKLVGINLNSSKLLNDNQIQSSQINGKYEKKDDEDSRFQESILKIYIDNKFVSLEKRLIERIELMEQKTSQKLDAILKRLELNINS